MLLLSKNFLLTKESYPTLPLLMALVCCPLCNRKLSTAGEINGENIDSMAVVQECKPDTIGYY